MLNAASSLKGFDIQAEDGGLGTVSDFLFDDSTWEVRWLVVETGRWLTGRKVLLHPSAVISARYDERKLYVALTKAKVADSPSILWDRPFSQQMHDELYDYYGRDPLWAGGLYAGSMYGGSMYGGSIYGGIGATASPLSPAAHFGRADVQEDEPADTGRDRGDPHLRSIAVVTGYHAQATDGNIGDVQDFLIEDANWGVRYLVIDTSDWWVGQHVLISPFAVESVDWSMRHVRLDLTRDKIRSSPSWNPSNVVDGVFERRLHTHYGWPGQGR